MDKMKISGITARVPVLVKRIIAAEILLGLVLMGFNYWLDIEGLYKNLSGGNWLEYETFSTLVLIVIEVAVVWGVYWFWHKGVTGNGKVGELRELIDGGEGEKTEFKQTLRFDIREGKYNKDLEKAVLKNMAGFLNAEGGVLIIGVSDDKEITGLDNDYKTLPKPNRDGFENHLNQLIGRNLGWGERGKLRISVVLMDGKEVCLVEVKPASAPVYYRDGEDESFFVRTGNSTNALTISQATKYIGDRWQKGKK
jgi:hypothetical protein